MAWSEHLGGNKYKLVERDTSKAKKPKRSTVAEMPEEIYSGRSQKRKDAWLVMQEEEWSEQVRSGKYQDNKKKKADKKTFAEFTPIWVKLHAESKMSGGTIYNSQKIIDSRLLPEFGDSYLDEITTIQIVSWFSQLKNSKTGETLSTNSKLNIYKVIKSIFDKAFEWNIIQQNPMIGVDRPSAKKDEKKKMRDVKKNYTKSEAAEILLAMNNLPDHWRLYFTGVLLGGFRRGELLAIEWSSLDYEQSAIYIENQITIDKNGSKEEREVKTEESEGWVPMPEWYMTELKRYKAKWGREKLRSKKWLAGNKEYIFHGKHGVMYYPSSPTREWSKFLKANKLPHVNLHGLRHTAATLLREHGADQRSIQKFLRHTKIETTNRYVHEQDAVNRSLIDPLDALNPKRMQFAP